MGSGRDDIRIGDTERNEARALLDIHLTEGRLTYGEHEERCVLAGAARFVADIEKLFADLPAPHPEPDAEIRVGDTERNETRALLDIHLTEGRLTLAEHEERCALAGAAQVKADVEELFADLPAPHPDLSGVIRPRQPEQAAEPPKAELASTSAPRQVTPVSEGLAMVAFGTFFLGLPVTIVATILWGVWWTILVNTLLLIISFAVSVALETPKPIQAQGSAT